MTQNEQIKRYHSLSIVLHWLMAFGIFFMLVSGLVMTYVDLQKSIQFQLIQVHKATGVIILWALIVRILVRLFAGAPSLPNSLSPLQIKQAKIGHIFLYLLLIVLPISGWFMVSASPFGLPTFVFFDWLKWPHIPGVSRNKLVENVANTVHWVSALSIFLAVIGHITAVVIHKKRHSIDLISRMKWGR